MGFKTATASRRSGGGGGGRRKTGDDKVGLTCVCVFCLYACSALFSWRWGWMLAACATLMLDSQCGGLSVLSPKGGTSPPSHLT
jgi:hypothetical protein